MTPFARRRRYTLAGLLLLPPSSPPPTRAGEPEPPPARMPACAVVKPGKVDPKVPLPFEPPRFDVAVGAVPPKARIPIDLEIHNTSSTPLKVLGGTKACTPQGCALAAGPFPVVIPPGESAKVRVLYVAPVGGNQRFDFRARLYMGGMTTFILPIDVTGITSFAPSGSE